MRFLVIPILKTADAMAQFAGHRARLQAAPSLEERAVIIDHMKQDAEVAQIESNMRQQHHKEQAAIRAEKLKEQAALQKQEIAKQKQEMAKQKMEQQKAKEQERVQKDKQREFQNKIKREQQFNEANMRFHSIMSGFPAKRASLATEYFAMIGGRL